MIPIILSYVFGTVLMVLEIFLPGFGVAGVCGIALELTCVALTWFAYSSTLALIVTAICVATVSLTVFLGMRSLQRGRMDKSGLVLKNEEAAVEKTVAFAPGTAGQAVTPLRPMGTALLREQRIEVSSTEGFIPAGASIRVVGTEGKTILVEKQ